MRQFFEPAEAPLWLKQVLFSIRDGLSDVWATALRLKDYTTASLPPAADWKQGLAYDSTTVSVKFSDGSNWTDLSAAGHTHTEADIQLSATNVIVGRATAGAGAAEEITCTAAGRALLDDADASAQRTTLGLGTAAVKNTGTSGNTVPLLDGAAATWTNGANFGGNVAVTGKITQTGAAGLANYLNTNSGQLASTTNLNPGLLVFAGNTYYGLDLGYVAGNYGLRLFTDGITRICFGEMAAGATQQSDFTQWAEITNAGFDLASGDVYKIAGTQVVTARQTGWGAATGTATRSTFDTATVTTTQLAERVKALIDDLITHGLIGT